jgi:hypothetical protein
MENDKRKIEEPFDPERTPPPAQEMDPNVRNENNRKQPGDKPAADRTKASDEKDEEKIKLLGESETEITDETTI